MLTARENNNFKVAQVLIIEHLLEKKIYKTLEELAKDLSTKAKKTISVKLIKKWINQDSSPRGKITNNAIEELFDEYLKNNNL